MRIASQMLTTGAFGNLELGNEGIWAGIIVTGERSMKKGKWNETDCQIFTRCFPLNGLGVTQIKSNGVRLTRVFTG